MGESRSALAARVVMVLGFLAAGIGALLLGERMAGAAVLGAAAMAFPDLIRRAKEE